MFSWWHALIVKISFLKSSIALLSCRLRHFMATLQASKCKYSLGSSHHALLHTRRSYAKHNDNPKSVSYLVFSHVATYTCACTTSNSSAIMKVKRNLRGCSCAFKSSDVSEHEGIWLSHDLVLTPLSKHTGMLKGFAKERRECALQ